MNIPGSHWAASVERVTPDKARYMLQSNSENRKLRKGVILRYATIMTDGAWKTSPEPIVFSESGRLLNGQHRLTAVVHSGTSQNFLVVKNVSESTFSVLDRGAIRSTADALGVNPRLVEAAKVVGRIFASNNLHDNQVGEICSIIGEAHDKLLIACNTSARIASSAPFRAAASMHITIGTDDVYVCKQYRSLVLGTFDEMVPVTKSIASAIYSGRLKSGGLQLQSDLFIRAWDMFSPEKQNQDRIQIKNNEYRIGQVRRIMSSMMSVAA